MAFNINTGACIKTRLSKQNWAWGPCQFKRWSFKKRTELQILTDIEIDIVRTLVNLPQPSNRVIRHCSRQVVPVLSITEAAKLPEDFGDKSLNC